MFEGLRRKKVGCRCLDLDRKQQSMAGWVTDSLGLQERSRVEADAVVRIMTRYSSWRQVGLLAVWGWKR